MSDFEPIDLDWSNAELKAGEREATVTKVEEQRSKKAGDLMLKMSFRFTDADGGTINDWIMLQGPGAPSGFTKLKRLGVAKGEKPVPADLVGRRVILVCAVEEDPKTGDDRLAVKKYLAVEGGSVPPPKDPNDNDSGVPF